MKNILLALRSLNKRGQHNILKIASLSIGMAVGLLLIAKVWFERSYDDFYPDSERVWQVYEFAEMDGKYMELPSAGGAAVLLVVLGVAAYNVYGAATANPVGSLKSE